jgi:predicted transcriptional regulator
MIAKELTTAYRLKQKEAATLLAVSQPAISLYYRKIRGRAIDLENDLDVRKLVEKMAKSLVESKPSRRELIPMYCEVCRTIRAKGLLCKLHKAFDPAIDIDTCELCLTGNLVKCS